MHWREKFLGLNHAQVFLHFGDKNGIYNKVEYDGRKQLGIPKQNLDHRNLIKK